MEKIIARNLFKDREDRIGTIYTIKVAFGIRLIIVKVAHKDKTTVYFYRHKK